MMKALNIENESISYTVVDVIMQFYCELQNKEWYLEEHKEYLDRTYGVLYWYIKNNVEYYNSISEDNFKSILSNVRNGHHYKTIEWFTVDQFIKNIGCYEEYAEKMGDPYILN
jgi:hypothetical protein